MEPIYRPTPDVVGPLCDWLSEGHSLKHWCEAHPDGPSKGTVLGWVVNDVDGFAQRYRAARRAGAESWADELVGLSDAALTAEKLPEVAARQLQVGTRKWLLSKLLPHEFGDKLAIEQHSRVEVKFFLPIKDGEAGIRTIEDGRED